MKRNGKSTFFIVAALILAVSYMGLLGISTRFGDRRDIYIKGAQDIRFGIDIRGGVDVTFTPPDEIEEDITEDQMRGAEEKIKIRLLALGIADYEIYTDLSRNRIVVRFPWKSGEENFDPEYAIEELGAMAELTFREGAEYDEYGPTGVTADNIILRGADIKSAWPGVNPTNSLEYVVNFELNPSGTAAFAEATSRISVNNGPISIWMDEIMISAPTVRNPIPEGRGYIEVGTDVNYAQTLARQITAGALPFKMEAGTYSTIAPSLGENALNAMLIAGIIAFVLICLFMIFVYRLPGIVSCIALLGHVGLTVGAISGFFTPFAGFTLTIPGIAGIILGIGFGVDANILSATRIREEIESGKSLDGAVDTGFKKAFTAVFDGNITIIITAMILMGAFGPSQGFFAQMLTPVFFMFGQTTTGAIYSFGYTLLISVMFNLMMGVAFSRIMLKSLLRLKPMRNPWFYGGIKDNGGYQR